MKRFDVCLGLGSNMGRREEFLNMAVRELKSLPDSRAIGVSSVYETDPVGKTDQPGFLNAVLCIETALEPLPLFSEIKAIEKRIGRKGGERWGPREIDIDILLYDGLIVRGGEVRIPHPEIENRRFVLVPLRQIAPDLIHPVSGLTVEEMEDTCGDKSRVVRSPHHLIL